MEDVMCPRDHAEARQYVGKRIRYFRKRKQWSRTELGAMVGLSAEVIGFLERGTRQWTPLEKLLDIAEALDITLAQLLGDLLREEDVCLDE